MTLTPSTLANASHGASLVTPLGTIVVLTDGTHVRIEWSNAPPNAVPLTSDAFCDDVAGRLDRYFRGDDVDFSDVPTPLGPDFTARCWEACRRIPRGSTISYGDLVRWAGGRAGAARAAGQAMRRNPLPIIVPCHRVISSDGGLYGYAGTTDPGSLELDRKRLLLRLEGALPVA